MRLSELPKRDRRQLLTQVALWVGVPIALLVLLFFGTFATFMWWQIDEAQSAARAVSDKNTVLITRLQKLEIRERNLEAQEHAEEDLEEARFRRTDILHCQEIERLKRNIVAAAAEAGLPMEPARRFRPRKCRQLPSVRP